MAGTVKFMMSRPLYRWKSFWFGLFVTCFLTSAWRDSLGFTSRGVWSQIQLSNGTGGIFLKRETRYSSNPSWNRTPFTRPAEFMPSAFEPPFFIRGGGVDRISFDAEDLPKGFRDYYLFYERLSPLNNWLLFLPYWLVILAFALPWTAFLIWRARSMGRQGSYPT